MMKRIYVVHYNLNAETLLGVLGIFAGSFWFFKTLVGAETEYKILALAESFFLVMLSYYSLKDAEIRRDSYEAKLIQTNDETETNEVSDKKAKLH